MKGQWIGKYSGSIDGNIMVNIDEEENHIETVAYINPTDRNLPNSVAIGAIKNIKEKTFNVDVFPVDPKTWLICEWDDIKHLYPADFKHSKKAEVSLITKDGKLLLNANTDIGAQLVSTLQKRGEDDGSKILGKKMSWNNFKSNISENSKSKNLFRGQKKPWRLRTSFHRRGRYRINEFTNKDVKQLHQRLSAITSHYFDLSNPDQNGAFFNLIQHHGYPTPLLDWTYSPYVAAFFAFRDWPIGYSGEENCRIYKFNFDAWKRIYPQNKLLDPPFPHLSVIEFIAINNPRLVPQQSVTTITNIDDIETYVLEREMGSDIKFLEAIDIPAKERDTAMRDLRFMGISAGSMFPSIDGVCEELRECNFES